MLQLATDPLCVRLDGQPVQPKITRILALMAVRAQAMVSESAWVTALEIAQLPEWQASKATSVGTEIYNAFAKLKLPSRGWIESPAKGKLKQWRWTQLDQLCFEPNVEAITSALAELAPQESLDEHLSWLGPAIESICLSNGVDAVAAADNALNAVYAGAHAPAITRAGLHVNYAHALARLGVGEHNGRDTADIIEQLAEDHTIWNAVGAHHPFRERIMAQLSFSQRRADGVEQGQQMQRAHNLARQANLMLQSGDTSSAGSLFNTAGCIANANEGYVAARRWLMSAIPLLFAHGAMMELEAALFNLTLNCVRSLATSLDEKLIRSQARKLADLDKRLAACFNMGREFIQTELLAAKLAIEDNDLGAAESALCDAERLLKGIKNPWEHGCYWRRLAHLYIARALKAEKPLEQPREALLSALGQASSWMRRADSGDIAKGLDVMRVRLARVRKEESWVAALRLACEGL